MELSYTRELRTQGSPFTLSCHGSVTGPPLKLLAVIPCKTSRFTRQMIHIIAYYSRSMQGVCIGTVTLCLCYVAMRNSAFLICFNIPGELPCDTMIFNNSFAPQYACFV
jgi:hypothetical protein